MLDDTEESVPFYDWMMAQYGPRLDESPWSPELLEAPNFQLPEDYELPPLPLRMMLPRLTALSTPTQMMEVISVEQG